MSRAYYNEHDPKAAAWLRELIAEGHISPGTVDERSIADVRPADLAGFRQCHFFAGIGGWSLALRLAGWPDDRPVWTGSCPCQPFSNAGARKGDADERHLWPAFRGLIAECRPAGVFGEQVASRLGRDWLAAVRADLEDLGYAVGAADLCAAGVGSPHIRQRLWFGAHRLADSKCERAGRGDTHEAGSSDARSDLHRELLSAAGSGSEPRRLADTGRPGLEGRGGRALGMAHADAPGQRLERGARLQRPELHDADGRGQDGRLADAERDGWRARRHGDHGGDGRLVAGADGAHDDRPGPVNGFWRDADWLHCRDDKWRPVEPGTFPLAHGIPARVGRLRGYGNAIVPQLAAAFIRCFPMPGVMTK